MLLRRGLLFAVSTLFALPACRTVTPDTSAVKEDEDSRRELKMCAGIRGNGNLIFAHFPALARISEHYGQIDAFAGGSSGSITTFLYESMTMNPALNSCADGQCTPEQVGGRLALMLKSIEGYIMFLGDVEEVLAAKQLSVVYEAFKKHKVTAPEDLLNKKTYDAILTIVKSPDVQSLINPELLQLIEQLPKSKHFATEIYQSITSPVTWSVADFRTFFRPGLINFTAFADKIGRIANFYAGYGSFYEKNDAAQWLNSCAEPARGKSWSEIAAIKVGETTCGQMFNDLLLSYRTQLLAAQRAGDETVPQRLDDPIGLRVRALISTSVLEGEDVVKNYDEARQRYMAGNDPEFKTSFDKVRFGYWGREEDLAKVGKDPMHFGDLKTKKFLALGEKPWRQALSLSPAEPGLARILPIDETRSSAGGWSDLHPTLVLKNLGCQNVIYVTRRGEESQFAIGTAQKLGMSPAEQKALYDLDDTSPQGASSFMKSIQSASVWCTDWNSRGTLEVKALFDDTYNAPFEVRSDFFTKGATPYPNAKSSVGLRGCTPGAPK